MEGIEEYTTDKIEIVDLQKVAENTNDPYFLSLYAGILQKQGQGEEAKEVAVQVAER